MELAAIAPTFETLRTVFVVSPTDLSLSDIPGGTFTDAVVYIGDFMYSILFHVMLSTACAVLGSIVIARSPCRIVVGVFSFRGRVFLTGACGN